MIVATPAFARTPIPNQRFELLAKNCGSLKDLLDLFAKHEGFREAYVVSMQEACDVIAERLSRVTFTGASVQCPPAVQLSDAEAASLLIRLICPNFDLANHSRKYMDKMLKEWMQRHVYSHDYMLQVPLGNDGCLCEGYA